MNTAIWVFNNASNTTCFIVLLVHALYVFNNVLEILATTKNDFMIFKRMNRQNNFLCLIDCRTFHSQLLNRHRKNLQFL